MGTSAANLTADLGYIIGQTIGASSRLTTTAAERLLNKGQDKLVLKLYDRKCWRPLHELHKEASYTLTGATSYDVYTVIGSSTDYFGFVNARLGTSFVDEVTIEEEYRIQSGGEYDPSADRPYICFYGYDTASGHGNLPKILVRPYTSTEILYFRYLKRPTTMQAATTAVAACLPSECDDAMLFYAASMTWAGDRNSEEFSRFRALWNDEVDRLIMKYEEPVFHDVRYQPVE
mgnify:CR=1 FL=1